MNEICGLCGNVATWSCKTCGEYYCEMHWHETSEGKNVECSVCETKRLKQDKKEFDF